MLKLFCLLSLGMALILSGRYQILVIPLLLSLSSQELSLSVPGLGYTFAVCLKGLFRTLFTAIYCFGEGFINNPP